MTVTPGGPSWRKPVGMLGILALILVWSVLVVTLADAANLPVPVTMLIYLGAGVAWLWIFPMRRLLRWMELGRWQND